MKILLTEPNEIASEAVDMLKQYGYQVLRQISEADQVKGLFIRTYTQVTKEYLAKFPELKFIIRAGVGLDNIDLDECKRLNIQVFNAPGSNANAVAEYTLGMIITSIRRFPQQISQVVQGKWRNAQYSGSELTGKTVGIVGCGAVGKRLAQLLSSFSLNMLGYDNYVSSEVMQSYGIIKTDFTDLIMKSDIVVVAVPLNDETKNMFQTKELAQMKKTSIFVNISRGEVVNEEDLIEALTKENIAGAVIDVAMNEPNIDPALLTTPNLIVTPHIAAYTNEANVEMAVAAVRSFLTSR